MKLLILRDLEWIVAALLLVTGAASFNLCETSRYLLYEATPSLWPVFSVPLVFVQCCAGLSLGLLFGWLGQRRGLECFLRERATTRTRADMAQFLVAASILGAATILALLIRRNLVLAIDRTDDGLDMIFMDDPRRWVENFVTVFAGLTSYALGHLVFVLPGGRLVKALALLSMPAQLMFLMRGFHASPSHPWPMTTAVAGQLVATATLTVFTQLLRHGAADSDRPIKTVSSLIVVALCTFGTTISMMSYGSMLSFSWRAGMGRGMPSIRATADDVVLVGQAALDPARPRTLTNVVFDADQQPTSTIAPPLVLGRLPLYYPYEWTRTWPKEQSLAGWLGRAALRRNPMTHVVRADRDAYLDLSTGEYVIRHWQPESKESRGPVYPTTVSLKRGDGRPFSSTSMTLPPEAIGRGDNSAVIVDRSDATIWGLVGDLRFVDLELPHGLDILGYSWLEAGLDNEAKLGRLAIETREGLYGFDGRRFVRSDERTPRMDFVVDSDVDPLTPEVVIRRVDGTEVFRHKYRLPDPSAQRNAWGFVGTALMGSPLGHIVASRREPYIGRLGVTGSLFADGRRPGLLIVVIVISMLVAYFQSRRLHRLGASRVCNIAWMIGLFFGGLLMALLCVLIERPRRHYSFAQVRALQSGGGVAA